MTWALPTGFGSARIPRIGHHHETVEFWAGSAGGEIASLICSKLPGDDFDYVSLGPGDGKKDSHLVSHWLKAKSDIIYYPYDISVGLVSRAIRRVRNKATSKSTGQLHIKAVFADFDHLAKVGEVLGHRPSPNVVALLGNSLGNIEREHEFLRDLKAQMSDQDILVLEVRLKSEDGQPPELVDSGATAKHFDFGALEHYLGQTFEPGRITVGEAKRKISSVSNTRTTVVGYEEIRFRGETYDEIKLIYIHEYTKDDFVKAVEGIGFEIIDKRLGGDDGFLVCVLRSRPT